MPVPRILEDGLELPLDPSLPDCRCPDVYYFNIPYQSYNFTTVTAVNIADNDQTVESEVYLLSGNQNMFVSQNNIYITYTKYVSEYQLIMEVFRELLYPLLPAKDQERIAKIEDHKVNDKNVKVYVHRKGATRAFPPEHPDVPSNYRQFGQPVLIPGSMGTGSWVLAGTDKAMDLSFGSTAHGAGRNLSRSAAKRQFWGKDVKRSLEQKEFL